LFRFLSNEKMKRKTIQRNQSNEKNKVLYNYQDIPTLTTLINTSKKIPLLRYATIGMKKWYGLPISKKTNLKSKIKFYRIP